MPPLKSIPKLVDAVGLVLNNAMPGKKWFPRPDGTTFCNEAVSCLTAVMGYPDFARATMENPDGAISANEMCDHLAKQTDWMEVPGDAAQQRANEGELVVAAWKNPEGHGHVCVVIPGEMEDSGHWGKKAPKVLNVGKDVFVSRGANWAFRDEPKFYISRTTNNDL